MRKILVLALALLIVLTSVAAVNAVDYSDAKLKDLSLPYTWVDRNISEVNGSSRLVAFSSDHSFEFGVDFDTDIDSKNLTQTDSYIYQDGDTIFEIAKIGSEKYHVYVKCNGTNNISSQPDKLEEAGYELFMFNQLNWCKPTEIT